MTKCKLSVCAFGLSLGLVWGLATFVMGLVAHYLSFGTEFVGSMSVLYIGYEPSIMGALIGGLYGFVDAFIGGALIAWFYNMFSCCCKKSCD